MLYDHDNFGMLDGIKNVERKPEKIPKVLCSLNTFFLVFLRLSTRYALKIKCFTFAW